MLFITAVFKIFKLSPDQFEVVHNLRDLPHKHINLNYSSNDVQWNPRDGKNGSVVIIFWGDQQSCLQAKPNYKYLSLLAMLLNLPRGASHPSHFLWPLPQVKCFHI